MSTYVKEKVLRIPIDKLNFDLIKNKVKAKFPDDDIEDDLESYLEEAFPDLFNYGKVSKFQFAPTRGNYLDYLLYKEWDAEGNYGKTRALSENEKIKYLPVFQKIDPTINMDLVRVVEFCWYNGCEAPDYYDEVNDSFYDEV